MSSSFPSLPTAATGAPFSVFTSWIAAVPTAPAAAVTRMREPNPTRSNCVSGIHALRNAIGNAAPSAKLALAGSGSSQRGSTATRSAYPPPPPAGTKPITRLPSSSPAISEPSTVGSSGICGYCPSRTSTSAKLTPLARTSTRDCPSATTGSTTSCTTSCSGAPTPVSTTAFISRRPSQTWPLERPSYNLQLARQLHEKVARGRCSRWLCGGGVDRSGQVTNCHLG